MWLPRITWAWPLITFFVILGDSPLSLKSPKGSLLLDKGHWKGMLSWQREMHVRESIIGTKRSFMGAQKLPQFLSLLHLRTIYVVCFLLAGIPAKLTRKGRKVNATLIWLLKWPPILCTVMASFDLPFCCLASPATTTPQARMASSDREDDDDDDDDSIIIILYGGLEQKKRSRTSIERTSSQKNLKHFSAIQFLF